MLFIKNLFLFPFILFVTEIGIAGVVFRFFCFLSLAQLIQIISVKTGIPHEDVVSLVFISLVCLFIHLSVNDILKTTTTNNKRYQNKKK